MDWNPVVGAATALTAVFTGWQVYNHARERPRPRWRATIRHSASPTQDRGWYVPITLDNVGDGDAYDVRIRAIGGHVIHTGRTDPPVVTSGESLFFGVTIPDIGEPTEDAHGIPRSVDVTAAQLGRAKFAITWNHPPFAWRRRKTFRLRRIA